MLLLLLRSPNFLLVLAEKMGLNNAIRHFIRLFITCVTIFSSLCVWQIAAVPLEVGSFAAWGAFLCRFAAQLLHGLETSDETKISAEVFKVLL